MLYTYIGILTIGVCYEWITQLFPDIPTRLDDESNIDQRFLFRNTFTGATTIAEIRRNEISIESESASTIAIVKENITRLANYRRISIEEAIHPVDLALVGFLSLVSTIITIL
jgi:hypothetical protein